VSAHKLKLHLPHYWICTARKMRYESGFPKFCSEHLA